MHVESSRSLSFYLSNSILIDDEFTISLITHKTSSLDFKNIFTNVVLTSDWSKIFLPTNISSIVIFNRGVHELGRVDINFSSPKLDQYPTHIL